MAWRCTWAQECGWNINKPAGFMRSRGRVYLGITRLPCGAAIAWGAQTVTPPCMCPTAPRHSPRLRGCRCSLLPSQRCCRALLSQALLSFLSRRYFRQEEQGKEALHHLRLLHSNAPLPQGCSGFLWGTEGQEAAQRVRDAPVLQPS